MPETILGLRVQERGEDTVLLVARLDDPRPRFNDPKPQGPRRPKSPHGCTRLIEVHRDGRVVAGDYPDVVPTVVPVTVAAQRAADLHAACFPEVSL